LEAVCLEFLAKEAQGFDSVDSQGELGGVEAVEMTLCQLVAG
jgi:hypothetical protein